MLMADDNFGTLDEHKEEVKSINKMN